MLLDRIVKDIKYKKWLTLIGSFFMSATQGFLKYFIIKDDYY